MKNERSAGFLPSTSGQGSEPTLPPAEIRSVLHPAVRDYGSSTQLLTEGGSNGHVRNWGPEVTDFPGNEIPTNDVPTRKIHLRRPTIVDETAPGTTNHHEVVVFDGVNTVGSGDGEESSLPAVINSEPEALKKPGKLKKYYLSAREHAFWYGLSYLGGKAYLEAAGNLTTDESTQNLVLAAGTYGVMLASLGIIGERVIRKLATEGHGGSIFAKIGLEMGERSIKKALMTAKAGKPALDEDGAEAMIDEVREQIRAGTGDKKTLKERDATITTIVAEETSDELKAHTDTLLGCTKRGYITGQFIEELPWYAIAYLDGIRDPRELIVFMAGTAIPTIISKIVMYNQYKHYSGTEPIMFPKSRRKIKEVWKNLGNTAREEATPNVSD